MLARASLLARGRSGPDQRYSSARARNQIAADRIAGVQRPGIDQRIREATIADATLISQFAVIHDGEVKFITRPVLVTRPDGEVVIHGSVGDTIGQFHPVEVMASEFRGHFTTLLQSRQIGELGLEDHPIAPETIPPPPVGPRRRNAGEQYQPDLSRLEFELPENPDNVVDADRPRITCLPKACGPRAWGDHGYPRPYRHHLPEYGTGIEVLPGLVGWRPVCGETEWGFLCDRRRAALRPARVRG